MRRHTGSRQDGFTLVELLVVLIIIGLLAAAGLAAFLGQRSKGDDASAKSDARSAQLAIEEWKQDHDTYDATVADLRTVDQDLANVPRLSVSGTDDTYTVTVRSSSPNNSDFTVTRNGSGDVSRTCTPSGKGGCPAAGAW